MRTALFTVELLAYDHSLSIGPMFGSFVYYLQLEWYGMSEREWERESESGLDSALRDLF